MPFPDISRFCTHVDLTDCFRPPGLQIRMPGGGVITVPNGGSIPSPSDQAGKLLGSLNAALMPLTPIFDILDILLTVMKVFEAVKSLNPIQIGTAVAKLSPKIAKLAAYIPQVSVPFMFKDILRVLICFLMAFEDELRALIQAIERANLALGRGNVLKLPELSAAALCMLETTAFQFAMLSSGTEPLNRLLVILNTIAGLVPGLGPLPQLEGADDADALLDSVTKLRTTLETIYSAVPG